MTFNPVPWAVKGGDHSERVLRRFANIATRDAEGVALPGDLKVSALDVSGAGVQIAGGGMVIRNRSIASGGESYIGTNEGPHLVGVANTGSSPRTDLVIARVKDPNEDSGIGAPADPMYGPFLFAEVITGVDPSITRVQDVPLLAGLSAITLARITQPAGSGAVTNAMITDLRKLNLARNHVLTPMTGPAPGQRLDSAGGARWPAEVEQVDVPEWATHVTITAHLNSVGLEGGNVSGILAVVLGAAGATQWRSSNTEYDESNDGSSARTFLAVGGRAALHPSLRGMTVPLGIEGRRIGQTPAGGKEGALVTLAGTHISYFVYFEERIV